MLKRMGMKNGEEFKMSVGMVVVKVCGLGVRMEK